MAGDTAGVEPAAPPGLAGDAAYHRRYRAAHRAAINAAQAARRRQRYRDDPAYRAAEHAANRRARLRALGRRGDEPTSTHVPLAHPYRGHPLLDEARAIAGEPWYGTVLYDPLREDAAGEALLAHFEGRDPRRAVASFLRREWRRRRREGPLRE